MGSPVKTYHSYSVLCSNKYKLNYSAHLIVTLLVSLYQFPPLVVSSILSKKTPEMPQNTFLDLGIGTKIDIYLHIFLLGLFCRHMFGSEKSKK